MNEWWHEQDQDDAWIQQQEAELQQYEESEGPLFADGFRDALIGIGYQFNQQVAIYDYAKCVYVLERQGMTREEALEYMEFNDNFGLADNSNIIGAGGVGSGEQEINATPFASISSTWNYEEKSFVTELFYHAVALFYPVA